MKSIFIYIAGSAFVIVFGLFVHFVNTRLQGIFVMGFLLLLAGWLTLTVIRR